MIVTEYAVATDQEDHSACCKSIYVCIRCALGCFRNRHMFLWRSPVSRSPEFLIETFRLAKFRLFKKKIRGRAKLSIAPIGFSLEERYDGQDAVACLGMMPYRP